MWKLSLEQHEGSKYLFRTVNARFCVRTKSCHTICCWFTHHSAAHVHSVWQSLVLTPRATQCFVPVIPPSLCLAAIRWTRLQSIRYLEPCLARCGWKRHCYSGSSSGSSGNEYGDRIGGAACDASHGHWPTSFTTHCWSGTSNSRNEFNPLALKLEI
jgi:hypothetical protein